MMFTSDILKNILVGNDFELKTTPILLFTNAKDYMSYIKKLEESIINLNIVVANRILIDTRLGGQNIAERGEFLSTILNKVDCDVIILPVIVPDVLFCYTNSDVKQLVENFLGVTIENSAKLEGVLVLSTLLTKLDCISDVGFNVSKFCEKTDTTTKCSNKSEVIIDMPKFYSKTTISLLGEIKGKNKPNLTIDYKTVIENRLNNSNNTGSNTIDKNMLIDYLNSRLIYLQGTLPLDSLSSSYEEIIFGMNIIETIRENIIKGAFDTN